MSTRHLSRYQATLDDKIHENLIISDESKNVELDDNSEKETNASDSEERIGIGLRKPQRNVYPPDRFVYSQNEDK